jgi:hypothetical protein
MLQWKPRLTALAVVLVLTAIASALGFALTAVDLFW